MRSATPWLLALLVLFGCGLNDLAARAEPDRVAVSAVVQGSKIQKVGFRAMVQRLAIQKNLAGFVRNGPGGTVEVRLEGAPDRVDQVIAAMREGTGKSSRNNDIRHARAPLTEGLSTFTIYGWTSASRKIETPYDLVFALRPDDREISRKAAKETWNALALATLKGADRAKFNQRLKAGD